MQPDSCSAHPAEQTTNGDKRSLQRRDCRSSLDSSKEHIVNFSKYSKKYPTSSYQVRAKTAFYLACVMEEDADLADRESNRVQRSLTELCIGPDLLNLAFHQDEASEYVAR